jgi:hypothetical protein
MDVEREAPVGKRRRDGVFGGVFLIGIGLLAITNWWWPGIMFVLGVATAARDVVGGRVASGITSALVFFAIGIFVPLLSSDRFDNVWDALALYWPLFLVGFGVIFLVRAFLDRT